MVAALHHVQPQAGQAVNTAFDPVAALHSAHALGSARENQVTGLQFPGSRQVFYGFGNAPDQLRHRAALALLAIDPQPDGGLLRASGLRLWRDGTDGRAVLKAFADAPRAPLLFHFALQIAPCHVQADRIAVDMPGCVGCRNALAA